MAIFSHTISGVRDGLKIERAVNTVSQDALGCSRGGIYSAKSTFSGA